MTKKGEEPHARTPLVCSRPRLASNKLVLTAHRDPGRGSVLHTQFTHAHSLTRCPCHAHAMPRDARPPAARCNIRASPAHRPVRLPTHHHHKNSLRIASTRTCTRLIQVSTRSRGPPVLSLVSGRSNETPPSLTQHATSGKTGLGKAKKEKWKTIRRTSVVVATGIGVHGWSTLSMHGQWVYAQQRKQPNSQRCRNCPIMRQ